MDGNAAKKIDFDPDLSHEVGTREILEKEYQVDTKDVTNSESLTYVILDLTVNGYYDRGIRDLKAYLEYKSNYPTYHMRTHRLFQHIENVVHAIKAKRNLMAVPNLAASKKKELHLAVINHFRDLKVSLQRLSQIEFHMRMRDSRSTLWVIKAFFIAVFLVAIVGLLQEAFVALKDPVMVLERDAIRLIDKLFN